MLWLINQVTESTKQELKEKLLANTDDPEMCLRLKGEPGGQLGLVLDREAPLPIVAILG